MRKKVFKNIKSLNQIHRSKAFEHIVIENIEHKAKLDFSIKIKNNPHIRCFNDGQNSNSIYYAMNLGIEKLRENIFFF